MRMIGVKTDWASAKVAMANPKKFLEELKSFDKDNAVHLITCLRNYCEDERFSYDNVARVNKGTASLTSWINAIYDYVKVKETLLSSGVLVR